MDKRKALALVIAGVAAGIAPRAQAQTDGRLVFRCTTVTANGNYAPRHVLAVWVEDSSGVHVKTLQRQAAARINYLTAWRAVNPTRAVPVDAVTGATLANHNVALNLTWNCRDMNGALVADGTYRIRCEFTERNGTGPITTTAPLSFAKGPTAVNLTPADQTYFKSLSLTYTPIVVAHDVAVTSIEPSQGLPGSTVNVTVGVRNLEAATESISVVLSNLTSGVKIGETSLNSLAGHTSTNVTMAWNTAGLARGAYTLQAGIPRVTGEVAVTNNVRRSGFFLGAITHDLSVQSLRPLGEATQGDVVPVVASLYNLGTETETVTVNLTVDGGTSAVAAATASNLPAGAQQDFILNWPTFGLAVGSHRLRAESVAVSGETNLANNAVAVTGMVSETGIGLADPRSVGSIGGFCAAVALSGATLCVGQGATLTSLDVTVPGDPVRMGEVRLPGRIQSLAIRLDHIYAACGSAGVQIVDASDRRTPVLVRTLETSGHAWHASAFAGPGGASLLAVADGPNGVRLYDVAAPAAPTLVGVHPAAGASRRVVPGAAGDALYVLDYLQGLQIVGIASPGAPTLIGAYDRMALGAGLALAGTTCVLTDRLGTLHVVDVAVPAAPVPFAVTNLNVAAAALAMSGSTLYVAAAGAGVEIVDIANPAAPTRRARLDTPGEARDVALSGGHAYIADGFAGLQIASVTPPDAPALAGAWNPTARGGGMDAAGSVLFVASGDGGLRAYSVTNAARPALLGTCTGCQSARDVVASGNGVAFVADGAFGLRTVSVVAPEAMTVLGTYSNAALTAVTRVALSGARLALTDGRRIELLDVSAPAAPLRIGSTAVSTGYVFEVAVAGTNVVAAAGSAGVLVLRGNGESLDTLARYDVGADARATGVRVFGARAYVAAGPRWIALDLTDPANPAALGVYGAPAGVAGVVLSGNLAQWVSGRGLTVVDVANPLAPVTRDTFDHLTAALRVAAARTRAFLGEDDAGVAILDAYSANADADLLPDAWEQRIVDANADDRLTSVSDVRADADFDGDGATNEAEFRAGTDPTRADSVFAVTAIQFVPAGAVRTVRWSSVEGRTYTVHRTASLDRGFTPLASRLPATPTVNTWSDTAAPGQSAFYAVTVDP